MLALFILRNIVVHSCLWRCLRAVKDEVGFIAGSLSVSLPRKFIVLIYFALGFEAKRERLLTGSAPTCEIEVSCTPPLRLQGGAATPHHAGPSLTSDLQTSFSGVSLSQPSLASQCTLLLPRVWCGTDKALSMSSQVRVVRPSLCLPTMCPAPSEPFDFMRLCTTVCCGGRAGGLRKSKPDDLSTLPETPQCKERTSYCRLPSDHHACCMHVRVRTHGCIQTHIRNSSSNNNNNNVQAYTYTYTQ